jgi:hypothetical protein
MSDKLVEFLLNRKYIIDYDKNTHVILIEGRNGNQHVRVNSGSFECSCDHFTNKMYMCDHIKFAINKVYQVCHVPFVAVSKVIRSDIFENDFNPRYKEYKECTLSNESLSNESLSNESPSNNYNCYNCYICLEPMNSGRLSRCKQCDRYYHETCIYGWLRNSPMCGCPNCRKQWY